MSARSIDHVATTRGPALVATVAMATCTALTMMLFSTADAANGDWLSRMAIPARMAALVLIATLLLRWSGTSWHSVGLRHPGSWRRTAGLVTGGYIGVGAIGLALMKFVLPTLGITPALDEVFVGIRGDLAGYLMLLILVAWGSAAFGEELVFRGFVQSRIELILAGLPGASWLAALFQAVLFGLLHAYQGLGGALLAGSTGLVLGLVYRIGGRNLWPCFMLHGLVNTISLTALYVGAAPA